MFLYMAFHSRRLSVQNQSDKIGEDQKLKKVHVVISSATKRQKVQVKLFTNHQLLKFVCMGEDLVADLGSWQF